MEFEPDNLKFLCVGCHLYFWHRNPVAAHEWLKTAIPEARYKRLHLMSNTTGKTPDPKLMLLFIESEIKRYEALKKNRT